MTVWTSGAAPSDTASETVSRVTGGSSVTGLGAFTWSRSVMDAPLDASVDAGLFDLTAVSLPDGEPPADRFCFALDAPDLAMDVPPVMDVDEWMPSLAPGRKTAPAHRVRSSPRPYP